MCGGSPPSIPPPPPPVPEAPVAEDKSKRVNVGKDADKKRRTSKGYRGTLLTSGLASDSAQGNTKTLLGQ